MTAPIHLAEVGSTNDWVRDHPDRLAEGQWVIADRQTSGRGRMGRPWQSPIGNFMGSCRLMPTPAEQPAHLLSFVAALALHDVLAPMVDHGRLQLKWPNDLLLDGAKLSGILLERDAATGAVILGIGVNLRHAPDIPGRATAALAAVAADVPTPAALAVMLGAALADRRLQWRTSGFRAIREAWQARAHPVGTMLALLPYHGVDHGLCHGEPQLGRYEGIADDGALIVTLHGEEQRLTAGDIGLAPVPPPLPLPPR